MNRFVLFNCAGQTAGSFFMDMLQSAGVYCIDEYFNVNSFRPGLHARELFGDNLHNIKPGTKESLYTALEQINAAAGACDGYTGVKICGQQRNSVHDFDKVMNDGSILKIFFYRQTLAYYMTKYFHPKWADMMRNLDPEYKMDPNPFRFYERCITKGAENIISVNSEDIFGIEENSVEAVCRVIGANAALVKKNARSSIKDCPETTIRELLETAPDYLSKEFDYRFSSLPYEIDMDKTYLDCREKNINLGFIEKERLQ
jgi:hypothetical protein